MGPPARSPVARRRSGSWGGGLWATVEKPGRPAVYGPRGVTVTGKQKPWEHSSAGGRRTPEGPVRVGRRRSFPGFQPCSEIRNCFRSLCLSSSSAPDPRATRGILDFFPFRKSYPQTEPAGVTDVTELFRSCFLQNVIMVGARVRSSGAGAGKPAQSPPALAVAGFSVSVRRV